MSNESLGILNCVFDQILVKSQHKKSKKLSKRTNTLEIAETKIDIFLQNRFSSLSHFINKISWKLNKIRPLYYFYF